MASATVSSAAPSVAPPAAPAPPTTVTINWPGWAVDMVDQLNAQRAAAGVGQLSLCYQLSDAAEAHSADQAATNRMSHIGSDGSGLGDRANAAGYIGWTALGENVADGYTDVHAVMVAWMNSPDHRQNILDPRFTAVGVGEATSSHGLWFWTQDFGSKGC